LERRLSTKDHPVEVMNLGVSAYNLGQMYLRMREVAFKFQPDIIVLAVRKDTALIMVPCANGPFIFARPTFLLDGNGNIALDYAIQNAWLKGAEGSRLRATAWLRQHSHLW